MQSASLVRCLIVAGLLGALAGCGKKKEEGPTTFTVTGKVEYSDGTPFKRGRIEFNSVDDSTVRAVGTIDENGIFSLDTTLTRGAKKGAAAGKYKVTVIGFDIEREGGAPPICTLDQLYTIQENDGNNFTIKIPKR